MPIPTTWKVIGNSRANGATKTKAFKGKCEPCEGRGEKPKHHLPWEGYGYILEQPQVQRIPADPHRNIGGKLLFFDNRLVARS